MMASISKQPIKIYGRKTRKLSRQGDSAWRVTQNGPNNTSD